MSNGLKNRPVICISEVQMIDLKSRVGQIGSLGTWVVCGVLEEKRMFNVCTNGRTTG